MQPSDYDLPSAVLGFMSITNKTTGMLDWVLPPPRGDESINISSLSRNVETLYDNMNLPFNPYPHSTPGGTPPPTLVDMDNLLTDNNPGNNVSSVSGDYFYSVMVRISTDPVSDGTDSRNFAVTGFRNYPSSKNSGGLATLFQGKDVNEHVFAILAWGPQTVTLNIEATPVQGITSPLPDLYWKVYIPYADNVSPQVRINIIPNVVDVEGAQILEYSDYSNTGYDLTADLITRGMFGHYIQVSEGAPSGNGTYYTPYGKEMYDSFPIPAEVSGNALNAIPNILGILYSPDINPSYNW
ncbi:MAG TPA: hypothetical protein QF753_13695 [Victivallales bacterium]|nr:hypothetical protein [Victivallales bacterium]